MYKAYVDGSNSLNWCMYGFTWNGKTVITKENTGMTNNITEWLALFSLILYLPNDWAGMVFSDSLLVVNQYLGIYKIKDPELVEIENKCKTLAASKNLRINIRWIPRENNVCGRALDKEKRKERILRGEGQKK